MKRLVLGIATVLATAASASAADLPAYKAPPRSSAGLAWTGFYGGLSVGARWADNEWTSSNVFPLFGGRTVQPVATGSMDSTSARVAGYFGYNWQITPTWIVGIEGDVGWANNSKTANPAPGTAVSGAGCGGGVCTGLPTGSVKESWDGSMRGRIGSLVTPNTLVFATGGVAWQNITLAASCSPNGLATQFCGLNETGEASTTLTGWTGGGGLEQRISGNWLARVGYRYAEFGVFSHQFFTQPGPRSDDRFTANVKVRTHTLDFGLAYKF